MEYSYISEVQSVRLGLAPTVHRLLLCRDEQTGERWTLLTEDTGYLAVAAAPEDGEVRFDPARFPVSRRGWPEEW